MRGISKRVDKFSEVEDSLPCKDPEWLFAAGMGQTHAVDPSLPPGYSHRILSLQHGVVARRTLVLVLLETTVFSGA